MTRADIIICGCFAFLMFVLAIGTGIAIGTKLTANPQIGWESHHTYEGIVEYYHHTASICVVTFNQHPIVVPVDVCLTKLDK